MAVIGNSATQQAFTPAVDYFSGNGSTTAFTLSRPVASVAQVEAVIDNVVQNPSSAYTVSSNTITFTSAPLSGTNNIYVRYTSPITQVIAPGQGTVGTTSLNTGNTTGTGNIVLATSPTLVTPALGTPASGVMTNVTSVPAAQLTGARAIPSSTMPTGSVLQVVQTVKTDFTTISGTTYQDITGYTATITPQSTSNKILVKVALSYGESSDAFPAFLLQRNGTTVVIGDASSPGTQSSFAFVNTGADARDQYLLAPVNFSYLDSPSSTSALTYKVQVSPMRTGSRTIYINRSATIGDANQLTASSTLILMEIAG